MTNPTHNFVTRPSVLAALTPVMLLIGILVATIAIEGTDNVQEYGSAALLISAVVAAVIGLAAYRRPVRLLKLGLLKSARQIIPSFSILLLIGTIAATWMLGGVVPVMIQYGLKLLSPPLFLFVTCSVCALISVLTGSSWTTIATIGVAFMGIGTVLGYSPGWIAGAIISGAYFGDKVSPMSDTTVLASSTVGVSLFDHIRYTMLTSLPAMIVALTVFACVGIFSDVASEAHSGEMVAALESTFNLTPWVLIVPAATGILIYKRVNTNIILGVSSLLGLTSMFVFQPQIAAAVHASPVIAALKVIFVSTQVPTSNELLSTLIGTGGMAGMLPTLRLVSCAMIFGGVMMGTGMLTTITRAVSRHLRTPRSIVSATVGSGLLINSFTGDQYLSIILGGNLYKKLYVRNGMRRRVLSRALEDSVSATSVLIPWNSCGMTQSTVLGVATVTYFPYCIFNILSPLMSIFMVWAGYKIMSAPKLKFS